MTEHQFSWYKHKLQLQPNKGLSHTLSVEVLRDKALQLLPVFSQLEQRGDTQEHSSFLILLRQNLKWTETYQYQDLGLYIQ